MKTIIEQGKDENGDEVYRSNDGWIIRREYGRTPNGNLLKGSWVLRDEKGNWIDFHQFRHDLFEHNDFRLMTDKR